MLAADLRPLGPYVDARTKWDCECLRCGAKVSIPYMKVKSGQRGCRPCQAAQARERLMFPADEALSIMRAAGFTPSVPFPGAKKPWLGTCDVCGAERSPVLQNVAKGHRACQKCVHAEKRTVKPDCSVEGCTRKSHARGLCSTHYSRLRLHGSTDERPDPLPPSLQALIDELPELADQVAEGVIPDVQKCSACGEVKPLTEFYKASRRWNGVDSRCKLCATRIASQWGKDNAERLNAGARERWKRVSAEKRARRRADSRRYYARNAEALREAGRRYQAENPEYKRMAEQRRRARKMGNGVFDIIPKDFARLLRGPCAACGSDVEISLDHVVPIARGGRHSVGNLQPLCKSCNSSKGARLQIEWVLGADEIRTLEPRKCPACSNVFAPVRIHQRLCTGCIDARREKSPNKAKKQPKPLSAVCPVCGTEFAPGTRRQVYCTPGCSERAKALRKRQDGIDRTDIAPGQVIPPAAPLQATCKQCGNSFHASSRGKEFCSRTCRARHKYLQQYPSLADELQAECPECGVIFTRESRRGVYCTEKCRNKAKGRRRREASR
jgi:5-methylcytosine-specific restriction endonuclease McrA